MVNESWIDKIRKLWRSGQIHGLELLFDTTVLACRYVSLSYWLKDRWLHRFLNRYTRIDERNPQRRVWRDNLIDSYCVLQFFILLLLLIGDHHALTVCGYRVFINSFVAAYIVFEIYLNLFSIFFLPRQRDLGPATADDEPAAVNEPSTRIERSVLLLLINVLQVALAFAVFYRDFSPKLSPAKAFFNAILVLGTVGYSDEVPMLLVALQVFLDLLLLSMILGSLVGQAKPFVKGR